MIGNVWVQRWGIHPHLKKYLQAKVLQEVLGEQHPLTQPMVYTHGTCPAKMIWIREHLGRNMSVREHNTHVFTAV